MIYYYYIVTGLIYCSKTYYIGRNPIWMSDQLAQASSGKVQRLGRNDKHKR